MTQLAAELYLATDEKVYRDYLIERQAQATPYGVPYQPSIWGAGWDIQSFVFQSLYFWKLYLARRASWVSGS